PGHEQAPLELLTASYYAAPDDGNPQDRTVFVVPLPFAVEPGGEVQVELAWRARVPRTFARTGFRGDYFFFAHWFPKLGVFEEDGWNCHQYHNLTEYYSDFGNYRVSMTVPAGWVLGATGREVERTAHDDGSETHVYEQHDVHAFSWTTSPDFVVREQRFERAGLPPVDIRLLLQPEHLAQAERHFHATAAGLEHYGTWYGPYPYGHVTVVDPAYGSDTGGMEYPTFFTCGTRIFNPFGADSPESVTIHEVGHQFWYGVVANNEFEHAWIDEGLNTFSTIRTLDATYPPLELVQRYLAPPGEDSSRGFLPVSIDGVELSRFTRRLDRYREHAEVADLDGFTFEYYPDGGSSLSYDKTALWLATLERHLGWETLQTILSTFFERHRFGHATPDAFLDTVEEFAGPMDWFFDQVYRDAVVFDYAVDSVHSAPVEAEGFTQRDGEMVRTRREGQGSDFRTEVMVRRVGGGVFPVDVVLTFEDGQRIRKHWSGEERSKLFVVERAAKIERAEVDPDRVLMLDVDYTNNSRLREPRARLPAVKWASKWMIWFQDAMATFAYFI
ncbi:MAG TPA: M1 family metallopeptidase, partial [Candidatus Polarisedimenticolaceae bacterium]|nr:M1 family metallopeptidase [Candidatus Polarisedimenticolaceae bacterium]